MLTRPFWAALCVLLRRDKEKKDKSEEASKEEKSEESEVRGRGRGCCWGEVLDSVSWLSSWLPTLAQPLDTGPAHTWGLIPGRTSHA